MELDFFDKNHYRLYPLQPVTYEHDVLDELRSLFLHADFTVSLYEYIPISPNYSLTVEDLIYPLITITEIRHNVNWTIVCKCSDIDGTKPMFTFSLDIPANTQDGGIVNIDTNSVQLLDGIYNFKGNNDVISGYVVVGDLSRLTDAITKVHNISFVKTAVTWLKGHFVNSFQFINKNRLRIENAQGYPNRAYNTYWTTTDLLVGLQQSTGSVSSIISKGVLNLADGFNCTVEADKGTNTITFNTALGAGLGEADDDIPLGYYYDEDTQKYYLECNYDNLNTTSRYNDYTDYCYSNGITAGDGIKSINGTKGSAITLTTSGITVTKEKSDGFWVTEDEYVQLYDTTPVFHFELDQAITKCNINNE